MKIVLVVMLGFGLRIGMAEGQEKPAGEILDPAALVQVHTYCVDTSKIAGSQAAEVKHFLKAQSKPGKLFSDFPWTMAGDCRTGHAEAVVRIEFPLLNTPVIELGRPIKGNTSEAELLETKVLFEVFQSGSGKQLYKLLAGPLGGGKIQTAGANPAEQRADAMYNAFSIFREDLRSLPPASL